MTHSFLENLDWRQAEKNFDSTRKVSDDDLKRILEAVRFAPSSYGLQPYHVYVVSNLELQEKLKQHAWGQSQVTDCSHFLVFACRLDLQDRIDKYEEMSGAPKEYMDFMRGFGDRITADPAALKAWADKQTYIALGFAMAACAELEIDSCPMEGFSAPEFDQVLEIGKSAATENIGGLDLELAKNLGSSVCLALGYRAEEPQHPKVRYSEDDLFSFVK